MKKSVLILLGVLLLSIGVVSATSCTSDSDCNGGACITSGTYANTCVTCSDQDDSIFTSGSLSGYTTRTSVSGPNSNGLYGEAEDYCSSSTSLVEYYCGSDSGVDYLIRSGSILDCTTVLPGSVCSDGACVEEEDECSTDDDCSGATPYCAD